MKTYKYLFAGIVLASISFTSHLSATAGTGDDSEWLRPELTHPEMFKLHTIKKKIKCGDAELRIESACFDTTRSPDIQCRKQTIRLINSKKGTSKKLPLDGKPVKQNFKESPGPVLDTVVTSLACLKSQSGKHFIVLWYTCRWGRDCCGTNREWQRYFTDDGTNLTVGRPDVVPYDEILKKYGIPETGGTYIDLIYD